MFVLRAVPEALVQADESPVKESMFRCGRRRLDCSRTRQRLALLSQLLLYHSGEEARA